MIQNVVDIPWPDRGTTFVVADDDPMDLEETTTALKGILVALGYTPKLLEAHSVEEVLNLSLYANGRKQADAVVIDGSYGIAEKPKAWFLPNEGRLADGDSLADLLRSRGYKGPIFLATFTPFGYKSKEFASRLSKDTLWHYPLILAAEIAKFLKGSESL